MRCVLEVTKLSIVCDRIPVPVEVCQLKAQRRTHLRCKVPGTFGAPIQHLSSNQQIGQ